MKHSPNELRNMKLNEILTHDYLVIDTVKDRVIEVYGEITRKTEFIFNLRIELDYLDELHTEVNIDFFWNTEEPISSVHELSYEESGDDIEDYPEEVELPPYLADFITGESLPSSFANDLERIS